MESGLRRSAMCVCVFLSGASLTVSGSLPDTACKSKNHMSVYTRVRSVY